MSLSLLILHSYTTFSPMPLCLVLSHGSYITKASPLCFSDFMWSGPPDHHHISLNISTLALPLSPITILLFLAADHVTYILIIFQLL